MLSTIAPARVDTPMPHSYHSYQPAFSRQALHFHVPQLPIHTPPSLGSRTPPMMIPSPRMSRNSSSHSIATVSSGVSIDSPAMPSTPLQTPLDELEFDFEFSPPSLEEDLNAAAARLMPKQQVTQRPTLKRADTPRPSRDTAVTPLGFFPAPRVQTYGYSHSYPSTSPSSPTYRSAVDGGKWVVVDVLSRS